MTNLHKHIGDIEKDVIYRAGSYFVERHQLGHYGVYKYPRNYDLTGGTCRGCVEGSTDIEYLINVCDTLAKRERTPHHEN